MVAKASAWEVRGGGCSSSSSMRLLGEEVDVVEFVSVLEAGVEDVDVVVRDRVVDVDVLVISDEEALALVEEPEPEPEELLVET